MTRQVLITGATRGIGRAIADAIAGDCHLYIGGRSTEDVSALVEGYPSATPFVADLADEESTANAVAAAGPIDAVIHSAGAAWIGAADSFTRGDWRRAFEINVVAAADLTRLLLPGLRENRGHVVFLNSSSGLHTYPEWGMYCATKFALKAYADVLREEERGNGLRVTSIHPGAVDTGMQRKLHADAGVQYQAHRYIRPESVAAAVRLALQTTEEATIESLVVRPMQL